MSAVAIPTSVLTAPAGAVKLYAVIAQLQQEGKAPSRRMIADGMGLQKTSAVDRHISEAEKARILTVIRPRGGKGERNLYDLRSR